MNGMLRTVVVLGTALTMMSGVASAETLGVYQTTDRKMDFELATCGSSDKDLCVTLLAARGSAATKQVKPYVGKLVVNKAKAAGENNWKGSMRFGQYTLDGRMTLKPGKSFKVSGCAYIVICEDINLVAAK
jgi:uncharacterized protein (DUF2147 family)